jgi:hypothetical protein
MAQVREKLNAIIKKNLSQSIGFPAMARGKIIATKTDMTSVSLKKFLCFVILFFPNVSPPP